MTEQNGETWRKGPSRQPTSDGDYVYLTVPHPKSGVQSVQMPEWLADVIIADHELAAQREATAVARIEELETALVIEGKNSYRAQMGLVDERERADKAERERDDWERLAVERGVESEAQRFIREAAEALKKHPKMNAYALVTQLEVELATERERGDSAERERAELAQAWAAEIKQTLDAEDLLATERAGAAALFEVVESFRDIAPATVADALAAYRAIHPAVTEVQG